MLELLAYSDDPLCHGYTWTIRDEEQLAEVVAWLILGDHLHARDVLRGLDRETPVAHRRHLDRRIAEFTTAPTSDPVRWHRDGWIFQMVSWVAANLAEPTGMRIRAPQPRKADKGLDEIMVRLRQNGAPAVVVIGEDKATENSRSTITSQVWPEFTEFENQARDNEVVTEVGSLLEALNDDDRHAVITDALWGQPWHYRVAITITPDHDGQAGRSVLFAGYDNSVGGAACARRRAETLVQPAMRDWMDAFSIRIAEALTRLREVAGV